MQNTRITAFIAFELLRKNQQERKWGKKNFKFS